MSSHPEHKKEQKLGYLNLVVIVLSIYVLGALIVSTVFPPPPEVERTLNLIDDGICIFFLLEFILRFRKAPDKMRFMRWGWIDLVSSIPTLEYFRLGRAVRLVRLLRILRAFRSTRHLAGYIFRHRARGAFTTVSLIALLMLIFSSLAILQVEVSPQSNIKTAEDALWWAYVTMTTVGYGDKYPVTTEGRLIAAALMTTGVGLFGTFTGFLASWFVAERAQEDKSNEKNE